MAGLTLAGEKGGTKEAAGTVKSVSESGFVVTDGAGKDWAFDVDKGATIIAKGASHKMDALSADGKSAKLATFLAEKQSVVVKYWEKDGKAIAKEVRVK